MPRLSNIRIGVKLAIMSGITVLLVLVLIGSQLMTARDIKTANVNSDRRAQIALEAALAKAAVRGMRLAAVNVRNADSDKILDTALADYKGAFAEFNTRMDAIATMASIATRVEQVKKMKANGEIYAKVVHDLVEYRHGMLAIRDNAKGAPLNEAETARYAELVDRSNKGAQIAVPAALDIIKQTDDIVDGTSKAADQSQSEALTLVDFATTVTLALGAMTIVIMILTTIFGTASIARPMRALIVPLESIANGNFAIRIPGTGRKDEVGQIAEAVHLMAQKVSSTIANIKSSGREVTNASAEISTSTTDLSQRTEEQAASLEETSAAMEELSATVRKNAENAQMANSDATTTRDVANRGGQVVAEAVQAMAKIEESSRKISDIIGVIDEIARQTNLLALNAAVEAARAGEAGRGFAVVASEVRSLAQRSSQAAKDIKDLITNSNGQVKDGVKLVNRAGESLTEIVESINKVAAVVADIANASIEQATGIEDINRALNQMDEVTQQNSALVEENAATAKTLEHQAKAMDEQVSFFQIGGGDEHREPSRAKEPTVRPVARKAIAPPPRPVAAPKRAAASGGAGGARGMQTALATAVNVDSDWKEF
jgi:methyl-accepting chemotaxis protein